jgi:hypothetical protein
MTTAFVLGNGQSRLAVNLKTLKKRGRVFGCNALYRTFTPDVLVSTDPGISRVIQESGYSATNVHYTRNPLLGLGSKKVPKESHGWSSGPNALNLACMEKHTRIYMLGFDLSGTDTGKFNNVFADSEFYKKSNDTVTYSGNWIKQMITLFKKYPNITFYHVTGTSTVTPTEFKLCSNVKTLPINDFLDVLNIEKDV